MYKFFAKQLILLLSAIFFYSNAESTTTCDFRGVSVGDKFIPNKIMHNIGIISYKTNPKKINYSDNIDIIQKYGIVDSTAIYDWRIGPYCDESACVIPYGIKVGAEEIPVSVTFLSKSGVINVIDISLNETWWPEFQKILIRKYGSNWKQEDLGDLHITDMPTKRTLSLNRISFTHTKGGLNTKTNQKCELNAINIDVIFEHHDPLGSIQSIFEIKLISDKF